MSRWRSGGGPGVLPWTHRSAEILDAVRSTDSLVAAGKKLGLSGQRVGQLLKKMRSAGTLPDDVAELLSGRPSRVHQTAPGREASVPATDADERVPGPPPAPQVATPLDLTTPSPAGLTDAEFRRATLAPCVSCAHALVCAIKPAVDRWVAHQHAPEGPDPAIHIARRDEISCDHYLAVVP